MQSYRVLIENTGRVIDAVGVFAIVVGAVIASVRFARPTFGGTDRYRTYRQDLGRAILLGLEFLIAGDIIRTVGVAPTLENVFVLALIVVIRTFLSMALQLEVEGRWPWQRTAADATVVRVDTDASRPKTFAQ
jgi:uncharacterized membrane protein